MDEVRYRVYWTQFEEYINNRIKGTYQKIRKVHNKKLSILKSKVPPKSKGNVETVPNFVQNLSSAVFTHKELDLLNRGLKFAPKLPRMPKEDIIAELESGIKNRSLQEKQSIRFYTQKIFLQCEQNPNEKYRRNCKNDVTNLLKSKDVIYIKADKGNSLVILDKTEYENRVHRMIEEGPYVEQKYKNGNKKNPLPQMIDTAKEVAQLMESRLGIKNFHYRMNMQNPRVPYLYALPKIHKQGNQMRPIVSNISTPTEKLSGWLMKELNRMNQPEGMYVKNTIDFVNRVKDLRLTNDEIIVSFDVTALYPNVPVDIAIDCLVDHAKQQGLDDNIIEVYQKVAKTCMDQSFFQFRGKFYKQTFGTCMGSKIAPYLSNVFMCHFEKTASNSPLFPRIWLRYVDDVFAVVNKKNLNETIGMLNSYYPTIKFTSEIETGGILPFLDVKVIRVENGLDFGIYRKPTNTMRFITSDSHHNGAHKKAAFHSLTHRLVSIPMSPSEFEMEEKYIKTAAKINGYDTKFLQSILRKHKRKQEIRTHTNLMSINEIPKKQRICLPFYPRITNKIGNLLKKFDIELITKSVNMGALVCNYKDPIPAQSKSGIYRIDCMKCDQIYIGQTSRPFEKRFQEHLKATKNKKIQISAVADHIFHNKHHQIDTENSKIIKTIHERWKLDAYESLFMHKYQDKLMNNEDSPISSNLFKLAAHNPPKI